jgi:hypothetical protein
MSLANKKLGVLISCSPSQPNFRHGIELVSAALKNQVDVYLYLIDDAVPGVVEAKVQELKNGGLKLYACAYGAHKRNHPLGPSAVFAGLTVVNDLMASTDRFVSFN